MRSSMSAASTSPHIRKDGLIVSVQKRPSMAALVS